MDGRSDGATEIDGANDGSVDGLKLGKADRLGFILTLGASEGNGLIVGLIDGLTLG